MSRYEDFSLAELNQVARLVSEASLNLGEEETDELLDCIRQRLFLVQFLEWHLQSSDVEDPPELDNFFE